MSSNTTAGTTVALTASIPATFDATGYGALNDFTVIGEITDIGEYGRVYELVTHNPVATRRTEKKKGSFDDGGLDLQMALDSGDAGQQLLNTAVNSDANYSMKVTMQNGDIDYMQVIILSKTTNLGSVNNITAATVRIEVTHDIVPVAA